MNRAMCLFSMVFLLMLTGSCIRTNEADCVAEEYHIRIFVEDENYRNVKVIDPDEEVDETLPFGRFIETLHYTLQNMETSTMLREGEVVSKTDTEDDHRIDLTDIPYGRYRLTVWGNVMDNVPLGLLHSNNEEGADLYLASTQVEIDSQVESSQLLLDRTKGMLQIQLTNLPSYITHVSSTVTNVFESVGAEFNYTGHASVFKLSPVLDEVEVILAPSVVDGTSYLHLDLWMNTATTRVTPAVTLPPIDLNIHRNEITLVNVNYNAPTNAWEIWTYINGKWVMIHSLDVN